LTQETHLNPPRIALIHATPLAVEPINAAFRQMWPEALATNLLDDSLAPDLVREGGITARIVDRFVTLAKYVRSAGADGIMFTCSAFGSAIEAARAAVDVPVLKPNEAMLDEALDAGTRLGVLATFEPSIPNFLVELESLAQGRGLRLDVRTRAVPDAMAELQAGRGEAHDRLIAEAATQMMDCDAVLLSQFSMASAAARIASTPTCRVLTSPASAVARLQSLLR
jgi:Asp/Glu/hydantoin racemase